MTTVPTELEPIATHLQLLGYEVEPDDDGDLRARHPTEVDFFVRPVHTGVMLVALFGVNEAGQKDKQAVRRLARLMNEQALAVRIVLPTGAADQLRVEAWHALPYERIAFGRFLAVCQREMRLRTIADPAMLAAYLT